MEILHAHMTIQNKVENVYIFPEIVRLFFFFSGWVFSPVSFFCYIGCPKLKSKRAYARKLSEQNLKLAWTDFFFFSSKRIIPSKWV